MKFKKYTIIVFLFLGFFSTLVVNASEENEIVVCTTDVIGSIVRRYLGEQVDVVVLVQPSLCPADFDMKPSDVYAVRNAAILFKQNIPGEFWLQSLLDAAGNSNLTTVAIPGVYNTPEGAKRYIEWVGGNLTNILGVDLSQEKSTMLAEIDEVSDWMEDQALIVQASSVKVICMGWQRAFIESVGFNVVASYNPPETLSAGDIADIIILAENEEVALIVDNLQIDVEFGKGIADQVGAEHVVLTNFPGAIPGTESLAEMFRYNAGQLFESTNIWRYTANLREENDSLVNQITTLQIAASIAALVAIGEAVLLYVGKRKR